jgi:pimeloyl-ACP methyl ester carboxylesterase
MRAARSARRGAAICAAIWALGTASAARGQVLAVHPEVRGAEVAAADVRADGGAWRPTSWDDLAHHPLDPGRYDVRVRFFASGDEPAIQVPPCAGRTGVRVDSRPIAQTPGPIVVPVGPGAHDLVLELEVNRYERRVACGERPRLGPVARVVDGLGTLSFESPHASRGGGRAVVYVPPGHDLRRPGPLLVGTHPWNGSIWTYAAYEELLGEARARDVVLLMPSGLGNSLYTADAEDEVLRAIDALSAAVQVDPRSVSIWGASMGGAGATTIAFHHPDRFASVTSFFGDSRYDLSTYVRSILGDPRAAHRVNSLDVVDNARDLPVWLIHGEDDTTSPIRQSELLADAMQRRGFDVRFDRVPGIGHAGSLVARFLGAVVTRAAAARAPEHPARVTYWSVRPSDVGAYGVSIVRSSATGDAFIDVERHDDAVHVRQTNGVRGLVLARGALDTSRDHPPPIVMDQARATGVDVAWSPGP